MSIEGVGQSGKAVRLMQRAAPLGTGLAAASCSPEATSIGLSVALFTLLLLGVTPATTRQRVLRRAGAIIASPFRSILARKYQHRAKQRAPSLPSVDAVYVDGVNDEQWRSFCYNDLLKRGAKGDEFTAQAVLSRHDLSWDNFIKHPRPFKRGGGSLTAQEVKTIAREFGLSSEDAHHASVAWAVRATGKTLNRRDRSAAAQFFTCLATVALDEQPPSTENATAEGYAEDFAQLLSRSAHFIRSDMPHAHLALGSFLSAFDETDSDAGELSMRASQHQNNIAEAIAHLASIEPLAEQASCDRFELGDRLRDAHTAGVLLLLTEPFDIPALQIIGLEEVVRHAVESVYYPLYQKWKQSFPRLRTRLTPQNMTRLTTLKNIPPTLRHILTRA